MESSSISEKLVGTTLVWRLQVLPVEWIACMMLLLAELLAARKSLIVANKTLGLKRHMVESNASSAISRVSPDAVCWLLLDQLLMTFRACLVY